MREGLSGEHGATANQRGGRASPAAWRSISVNALDQLGELPREELVNGWQAIYGTAPPRGIKRPLLERGLAWHVQAKTFGGHTAKILRTLESLQRDVGRRRQAEAPPGPARHPARGEDRRALKLGSRLVREWRGRTHIVDVTSQGYLWNGKEYRSLSIIARKITGARWSGPRFFGL
jgi:Protein of unknown function (DUF2924)